jgi:hypothetical protein
MARPSPSMLRIMLRSIFCRAALAFDPALHKALGIMTVLRIFSKAGRNRKVLLALTARSSWEGC